MKHNIWMVIGCTIPGILLFIAPALGKGASFSIFLFMIDMITWHLLKLSHHGGHNQASFVLVILFIPFIIQSSMNIFWPF